MCSIAAHWQEVVAIMPVGNFCAPAKRAECGLRVLLGHRAPHQIETDRDGSGGRVGKDVICDNISTPRA